MAETAFAQVATVRFDTCMTAFVVHLKPFTNERFITEAALVRFNTCMTTLVFHLKPFNSKRSITKATFVWFNSSVIHFVALPRGMVCERHRTVPARIRTFSGVQSHVVDQRAFRFVILAANLTLERKRCTTVAVLVRDE